MLQRGCDRRVACGRWRRSAGATRCGRAHGVPAGALPI